MGDKMKIKEIDKETKKSKMKHILPIASAGIGLGVTCYLMQTGVLNYDNLISFNTVESTLKGIPVISNLPVIEQRIDMSLKLAKGIIDTVGIQGIILAEKSLKLATEVIKPIKDSEKFQNSKIYHKIKKVEKAAGIEEKTDEGKEKPKTSQAVLNLARNALGIGAKAFLIGTHQIDYNAVFNFDKLPHKLSVIADVAKDVDLNKVLIGIDSIKSVKDFAKERIAEKKQGDIPLINFKEILHNVSESIKSKGQFPRMMLIKNVGKEMSVPKLETAKEDR